MQSFIWRVFQIGEFCFEHTSILFEDPGVISNFYFHGFRCVAKDNCQKNKLTVKLDNQLIEAQAEQGICPDSGECCNEINVIRECSDPEFKNEGFHCVEKGQCFDRLNGRENSGITIHGLFISANTAVCPSSSQVCCKKDVPPPTQSVEDDTCESNEGNFFIFCTIWRKWLHIAFLLSFF